VASQPGLRLGYRSRLSVLWYAMGHAITTGFCGSTSATGASTFPITRQPTPVIRGASPPTPGLFDAVANGVNDVMTATTRLRFSF